MKGVQQHINHIATRMRPRIDRPGACQLVYKMLVNCFTRCWTYMLNLPPPSRFSGGTIIIIPFTHTGHPHPTPCHTYAFPCKKI